MNSFRVLICCLALSLSLCSCASHHPQKSRKAPISAAQVPDAVKQGLQSKFPNAPTAEWKKKAGNIYEAEFTVESREITVMFDATGKWLETETAIDPASVPPAVMDAVAKRFKGYKVIETQDMKRFDQQNLLYELHLENSKQILKILFSPEGAVLSQSSKPKK
jgi:hypothetical protein